MYEVFSTDSTDENDNEITDDLSARFVLSWSVFLPSSPLFPLPPLASVASPCDSRKPAVDYGAFIEVDDHYEVEAEEKGNQCDRMMEILGASWQTSLDRSLHMMQTLMKP